jgi:hypothetical protein
MSPRGRVRKYDHERILALYDAGKSLREIGEIVGCAESLVTVITRDSGRSARSRRYPNSVQWDCEQILSDYRSGMPVLEILDKHHISHTHFYRLCQEKEVPLRPRPSVSGEKNGQYKHGHGARRLDRDKNLTVQVAAICLGHIVPKGCPIHHMDEDPTNNNPENLAIFQNRSDHARYHQQLLGLQRAGLEVDAIQLVLENGGSMLPLPSAPLVLPQEIDRLGPHKTRY